MSHQELKRRKEEIERQRGITPEMKRYNEIKAGIITGTAGIGISIFLYVFMALGELTCSSDSLAHDASGGT